MSEAEWKLIFVYNAKSNAVNKIIDAAHKIISPSSYACKLCSLTHGKFSENILWKSFRKDLKIPFTFLYKNQFETEFNVSISTNYPVVLKSQNDDLEVFITQKELNSINKPEDLIALIKERI